MWSFMLIRKKINGGAIKVAQGQTLVLDKR